MGLVVKSPWPSKGQNVIQTLLFERRVLLCYRLGGFEGTEFLIDAIPMSVASTYNYARANFATIDAMAGYVAPRSMLHDCSRARETLARYGATPNEAMVSPASFKR